MNAPARRVLPQNLDAERSVIGGVLLGGTKVLSQIAELVEPADFYHPAHQAIAEAMVALEGAGRPIDPITLAAEMRSVDSIGKLRVQGGETYFSELSSAVVTVENIAFHARLVRAMATERRLIETAQEIAARGYGEHGDTDSYIDDAERSIFEIAQRSQRQAYEPIKKVLRGAVKTLETRYERKSAVTGVPSGYHKLDAMTAGFQPCDLIIIAARPSMGKTALAMSCAQNAAFEHKVPLLVFSLEMSKEALVERLLCAEARVDSSKLRAGFLDQRDWINITKAAGRISEAPIWIDDSGAPTLLEIRAKCRRWRADPSIFRRGGGELGLVVVDYLQLIHGRPRGRDDSREREVSEISRGLKALAKELRVPVVALSQLNRGVESRSDKRPQLSDLRESGAIEQDADLIAFIYRDEVYNKETQDKGIAEIIIGKQRNGPTGTVRLAFLNQYTRFESLSERDSD